MAESQQEEMNRLNSLINLHISEIIEKLFNDHSRKELPGLLKTALLSDFQSRGAALLDVQVELFQEATL